MRIEIAPWHVRSFRKSDLEALVRHANNRAVSDNLMDAFPWPYTEADGREWLRIATAQDPEVSFAIASEDELIGGIGLKLKTDIYRKSAEIGYWLGESYWGRGIATLAVRAVTDYGFDRFGLVRICAAVFDSNPASGRVLEKAGYVREGRLRSSVVKNGRVMDSFVYAIVRE